MLHIHNTVTKYFNSDGSSMLYSYLFVRLGTWMIHLSIIWLLSTFYISIKYRIRMDFGKI